MFVDASSAQEDSELAAAARGTGGIGASAPGRSAGTVDRLWVPEVRTAPSGRAEPAETSEGVGWQNFGKMLLVFGCIGSDFCNKICVLQHFSKSTRFSS